MVLLGADESVHVLSSMRIACGRVPWVGGEKGESDGCPEEEGGKREQQRKRQYLEDRVVPLNPSRDGLLLDVDDQVAPLEVAGHGDGDVEVADGLRPLVGEGVLLGLLFGARGGLLGGGKLCRERC